LSYQKLAIVSNKIAQSNYNKLASYKQVVNYIASKKPFARATQLNSQNGRNAIALIFHKI
jgi:hypothetical protein